MMRDIDHYTYMNYIIYLSLLFILLEFCLKEPHIHQLIRKPTLKTRNVKLKRVELLKKKKMTETKIN